MCTCGMAMATQQAIPARASNAFKAVGDRFTRASIAALGGSCASISARWRSRKANGTMVTITKIPVAKYASRQPQSAKRKSV